MSEGLVQRDTRALDPRAIKRMFMPVEPGSESFTDDTRLMLNLGHTGQPIFMLNDGDGLVFGRGQPALAMLDQDTGWEVGLSRVHAVLRRNGEKLFIEDMGSMNGTYVNHSELPRHQPHLLHDGDILQFGLLDMRVHYLTK